MDDSIEQKVFLGVVEQCPDVGKIGNFVYHSTTDPEGDSFHWVRTKESLVNRLCMTSDKTIIINGIPDEITEGKLLNYKLKTMSQEDLDFVQRSLNYHLS